MLLTILSNKKAIMFKKFLLTLVATTAVSATSFAVPAKRMPRQVTQPDGTTLTVMLRGDEHFHFTSTLDGHPVVLCDDGYYRYSRLSAEGAVVPSRMVAHDVEDRTSDETTFLFSNEESARQVRSLGAARAAERNALRMERLKGRRQLVSRTLSSGAPRTDAFGQAAPLRIIAGATGGEGIGVTGKHKGLVILVNFKDVTMSDKHSREEWDRMFNETGYSLFGNSGSVHDYFHSQSYGLLDLEFDVVGPVTVSKNMSYYGGNDGNGNDRNPAAMVYEACQLVDDQVNFEDYDWDGDGYVDQVYVIYAGYGEATGGDEDTIWPHEWGIVYGGYDLRLDNTRINTYACSQEFASSWSTDMTGIGTPCHEFSHCLGLPDMYDTAYGGGFGLDDWGIMDTGSYGGDGYRPVGYNTYEKWVSGWLAPTVLDSPGQVKDLKPLSDAPEAYVIYNDAVPTEYYIVENRQLTGTDTELPAHGMLVLHVDYDKEAWEQNVVNNDKSHQRITIVPADNRLTSMTTFGDTFPGEYENTELTDDSRPAARLFNANADGRKYLGKPITDIAESSDGYISFTFMNGGETGVNTAVAAADDEVVEVYSHTGSRIGRTTYGEFMRKDVKGVYLLRKDDGTALKVAR